MLLIGLTFTTLLLFVDCASWNATCPTVSPRLLDLKELDGTWYLSAAASDLQLQGECATVQFQHGSSNTTSVSISWIQNRTASHYNGSAVAIADPNNNATGQLLMVNYDDQKTESYYFLDVDYEHYAVVFACNNSADGNSSTYELWKLSRRAHLKADDLAKINDAITKYDLQDTEFMNFNNTEECCKKNAGDFVNPGSLVMTSAVVLSIFRRF